MAKHIAPGEAVFKIPSPGIPVDKDHFILSKIHNSSASTKVDIFIRMIGLDGKIKIMQFDHIPTQDKVEDSKSFQLTEGYLIGVSTRNRINSLIRGEAFIQLSIQKGNQIGVAPFMTFFSDYLTSTSTLSWPAGFIQSSGQNEGFQTELEPADPAAGAEFMFTFPTKTNFRVYGIACLFTTDANAANRTLRLSIQKDELANYLFPASAPQVASTGFRYTWSNSIGTNQLSNAFYTSGMLPPILLNDNYEFRIEVTNIQAGDQLSAIGLIMEQYLGF